MPDEPPREWFVDAFGADYLGVYPHRDDALAAEEVRALAAVLVPLPAGARLLDLGCGGGRHLRALRAAGHRAAGCDLSAALLAEAARAGTGGLVRADMRRLPFRDRAFDAVLSFFTSFGYLASDAEDAGVLAEAARVLRPGGALLLDLPDADAVRRDLVPRSERTAAGGRLVEERTLSPDGSRVEKRVTLSAGGATRRWTESVRLYRPAEVEALAAPAGLRPGGRRGALAGTAPRCVLVLRREGA